MNRTISSVGWMFGVIGTLLLALGALFAWRTQQFIGKAAHAEGVVVEMVASGTRGRSYAPVIEFTTAHERHVRFRGSISSSPPAYDVGERVGVYYLPQAPETARIDTPFQLWFVAGLLAALGALFAAIGFGILAVARRAARIAEELRRTGKPLQAEFDRVDVDRSLRVNNRYPWRIHVRWRDPATGTEHVFRSQRLWQDPTPDLRDRFTVFVDPRNYKRYHVDVSFLPELAAIARS
jgi:hypothetical protein